MSISSAAASIAAVIVDLNILVNVISSAVGRAPRDRRPAPGLFARPSCNSHLAARHISPRRLFTGGLRLHWPLEMV